MNVEFKKEPFEHFVFKEFFTNQELVDVWRDLNFVENYASIDNSRSKTGTATSNDGKPLANRKGINLNYLFNNNYYRNEIKTYLHSRKIYSDERIIKTGTIGPMLSYTNQDTMLFNFYSSGDFYKPHGDASVFTFLCYLWEKEKDFKGGVLKFNDYNYEFDPTFNSGILFPSCMIHSISEIVSLDKTKNKTKRICVTMLIGQTL